MANHEKKCFYNEASKSCVKCFYLITKGHINGIPISEHEENIIEFKVEGTFRVSKGGDQENYFELNDQYKYLYDVDYSNYCILNKVSLIKLRTNCEVFKSNKVI